MPPPLVQLPLVEQEGYTTGAPVLASVHIRDGTCVGVPWSTLFVLTAASWFQSRR